MSKDDIQYLTDFLTKYNVSDKTQKELIGKLKKGETWDSIKKDSQPVSSYEVESSPNNVETVTTFEDGSIMVGSIEITDVETLQVDQNDGTATISPMAVDPGTSNRCSGYVNYTKAKVYNYGGVANAHFYADFTNVQGGYDYISRVYDYKIVGIGGSATYDNLAITRAHETVDYKASAKLDFTWVAFNSAGSTTCWLKLFVGKDSYSSDYSY